MKLTKKLKQDIINSIISDIPQKDYKGDIERTCQIDAIRQLPDRIKEAIKEDKKLLPYLMQAYHRDPYFCNVPNICWQPSLECKEKVTLLRRDEDVQAKNIRKIKIELEAIFESVNTDGQLLELYPEFKKYITEPVSLKFLPATNTLKKLIDSGWK